MIKNDKVRNTMTKPKENLKEIKEQLAECKNGWLRTQADFENYRKRMELQKAELIDFATKDLIEKIIPILDNFALAIKHTPKDLENNEWVKGILHIKKHFEEVLASEGLTKISETGKFDPNLHEAISHEPSELEEDTIIETLQSGYILGDKVIRPAKVRVANGRKLN
jgi:molecular chaperone GrpE